MNEKIGILICGNSGADYEKFDYPIKVIRSTLNLGEKEYVDYVDLKAEDFYDIVVKNPNINISTSQTALGIIEETYKEFIKEGYNKLIVITISSKLSGTYQACVLAKEEVSGIDIEVIDSKSVSYGELYLAKTAIECIKNKESFNNTIEKILKVRDNISIYVVVDTLKYLIKNGRLSYTKGFIAQLLKVKPILKIDEEGKLLTYEKIRTTPKAHERILEIIKDDTKDFDPLIFLAYTNNKEKAEEIKGKILGFKPNADVIIVPLTPVVGAHAGPGTIAIGYIKR